MFPLQHLKRLAKLQPLFSPGRYTLPSIQTAKNFSTTNQNGQVDKVYELRTYSIHPSKVTKFMQLTKENFHLRTNHSKLYGYWTSELGGLCEVVHIWEYDSFAHRTGVRKALSEDPEWISRYLSKMTKLIVKQDNIVLQAVPWHPVHETPLVEGSVYELRYYVMKPAVGMSWLEAVKAALESRAQKYDENKLCKIMGVWVTDVGPLNMVYHLWNWTSLDDRRVGRETVNATQEVKDASVSLFEQVVRMDNKILLPTSFSPMK